MTQTQLVQQLKGGLDAPICLTWELTYACNLACVHCLSSSGRRDPRELSTAEAKAVLDELQRLQVFYINIGGGEPMIRRGLLRARRRTPSTTASASSSRPTARTSTRRRPGGWRRWTTSTSRSASTASTPTTNDAVRGVGSYATARRAMDHLGRRRVRAVQDLASS